jgi:DNA-directed RNA polymerase subunit omega
MAQGRLNLMDPPIEDLLDKVDSKFTLVALGALRARQVNAYYNSLGEGIGRVVPPQVASVSGKPLSIAFEEIAASKATYIRVDPEELAAAELAALEALELVEGEVEAVEAELTALEGGLALEAIADAVEAVEVAIAEVVLGGDDLVADDADDALRSEALAEDEGPAAG